jgi:hypothetical protein
MTHSTSCGTAPRRARHHGRSRATGLRAGRAGLAGPDRRPARPHRNRRPPTPGPDDLSGFTGTLNPLAVAAITGHELGRHARAIGTAACARFYLALSCILPVRWASEPPSSQPASAWSSAGPAGRHCSPAPSRDSPSPPSTAACKWPGTRQRGQASCRSHTSSCSARSRSYIRVLGPRNTCSGRCSMRSGLAGRVIPASPASSASEPRREGLAAQCPLHQFDPAGRGCQLEALFPVGREHAFDGMKAGRESYHTAATSSARSHTGGWPATGVRGIRKASMPGRYFTPIRSASHRSNSPATRA